MNKFDPREIVRVMGSTGLVPVFYHGDEEVARNVLDAAYKGGVRTFEFADRGPHAFEVFEYLLEYSLRFDDLKLGIGTVMSETVAQKYIDAGAHFIVSPILKKEIGEVCNANATAWIPGCATLTEIVTAHECGAQIVKLFPASILGSGFVSAVLAAVPGLKLMPTGGVEPTKESLSSWYKAGVYCVGMGSQLFTQEIIQTENWAELEQKVAAAISTIKALR